MKQIEFEGFIYVSHNTHHPHVFWIMDEGEHIFVDKETEQIFYETIFYEMGGKRVSPQQTYDEIKHTLDSEKVNYIIDPDRVMIAAPLDWLINCAKEYGLKEQVDGMEEMKKKIIASYLIKNGYEAEA